MTTTSGHVWAENDVIKQLKFNLNRTFDAYHQAEKHGLLVIQLKDVFEAPLAQRRRNKRSTSSNASSESNVSTNSISSSLSTSTTSVNNGASSTNTTSSYTPTKKCPSSCGKLGEQTVFNFSDNCVSNYLKQNTLEQSTNRPITRSITHSKLGTNKSHVETGSQMLPATTTTLIQTPACFPNPKSTASEAIIPKILNQVPFIVNSNENVGLRVPGASSAVATAVSGKHLLELENSDNGLENHQQQQQSQQMTLGPVPPLSKRLKRCSTILID